MNKKGSAPLLLILIIYAVIVILTAINISVEGNLIISVIISFLHFITLVTFIGMFGWLGGLMWIGAEVVYVLLLFVALAGILDQNGSDLEDLADTPCEYEAGIYAESHCSGDTGFICWNGEWISNECLYGCGSQPDNVINEYGCLSP